jgi:hypothetical protein
MGKAVGGPKSYDSTETVVLYKTHCTPFSASVVQWKENFLCSLHKMMETGELVVVYREGDEDRSSEAAMCEGGGGAQRPALQVIYELKRTGARSARARTRGQNLLVF